MLTEIQKQIHEKALALAENFRCNEASLIEALSEVDQEKVYLALGYSSLFVYGTECLCLSEANSYIFIQVARKSKQVPELKEQIKSGKLTVSKAKRIVSVLTPENKETWLRKAAELPKAVLEKEVAQENPQSPKREVIKRESAETQRVHVSLTDEVIQKLKRAQALASSQTRKALNLEETLDVVLNLFLKTKDPVQRAERVISKTEYSKMRGGLKCATGPGPSSKHSAVSVTKRLPIPALIQHQIHRRDQGKCQYKNGAHVCANSHFIEIHHKRQVSNGGGNELENLVTLCGPHHKYIHL